MACAKYDSLLFMALAGTALVWTTIISHNYFHKRDNWRMYAFNLSMMNFTAWRVSHALSHHIYPNSYNDMELSMFEPFLCWIPNPYIKSKLMRYVTWVTEPISYAIAFFLQITTRYSTFSITYLIIMLHHFYFYFFFLESFTLCLLVTACTGMISYA